MKKTTLFILFGLLALLFALSLAIGWRTGGEPAAGLPEAPNWIGGMDGLLGGMAPALPLNGLTCNGQPVDRLFKLQPDQNGTASCEIRIPAFSEDDYRRTELNYASAPARLFVLADAKAMKSQSASSQSNCLSQAQFRNASNQAGATLVISYQANGEGGPDQPCWLPREVGEPYPLTVLAEGGTLALSLTCNNCGSGVRMRLQ